MKKGQAAKQAVHELFGHEVRLMKTRAFCFASLVLVVFALCVDLGAKGQFSQGMSLRAHSVTASPEQRQQMRSEATSFETRSVVFGLFGLCLAVSSLVCLVVSFRRHEPAWWRSVPVALLVVYLLLQFTLV
jgi:hypothetical protein